MKDSFTLFSFPPRGDCPTHGDVEIFKIIGHEGGVSYVEHSLCPKCYIDWIAANVTAIVPRGGEGV